MYIKVAAADGTILHYKVTINRAAPLSHDAGLTSVAAKTDSTPGGQSGADTANAIAWELSVDNAKSSLALSDIVAAANAAVSLYSNSGFTNEITGTDTLPLTAGGTTTAYIKVTAENGTTVMYYAVAIIRPAKLSMPTGLAWDAATKGKAVWNAVSNAGSYAVQLYKDGTALGSAVTGLTDRTCDFSSAITASGEYTFKVTAIGNGTTYLNSDTTAASPGLTVYTVYFKSNYDSADPSIYTQRLIVGNSKPTPPEQPARSGYTFGGWYTETACTYAWNFKYNPILTDTILYARWEPVAVPKYTVVYNGNGATSGIAPVDGTAYNSGSTVYVKANTGTLAKAGHTFGGWNLNGTTYTAGQTFVIREDVTLAAVWTPVAATYTATFNNNFTGGGIHTSQTGITSGANLTAPPEPSRGGYAFIGWYKDAACVNPWNFSADIITTDINLYAKWAVNTHTVSGTVADDAPAPVVVSGAAVKAIQGNKQFGTTAITDGSGSFTITGIPDGTYNLVVTKDDHEVTVCITVQGGNYTYDGSITLPGGNKNSKLDVIGSDTPSVVVDNLNNVFNDSGIFDEEDRNTVTDGGTVEIRLTVQKNEFSTNRATVEAVMSTGGYTAGTILDVDLTKTATSSSGVSEETSISATSTPIKIIIPLPAELQGKAGYVVYRAHNYGGGVVADAISTVANANGEYIEVSSDKTQLTAYLKYFSTYAIAYADSTPVPPSTPSNSSPSYAGYEIIATAGAGGSISPSGSAAVARGADKSYTIIADKGYYISDVLVDGTSIGAAASHTFRNVSSAHAIKAVFARITGLPYYVGEKGENVFIGFSSDAGGTMKYVAPQGKSVQYKENPKNFKDISDHWAKAYIDFVTEREIFFGAGGDAFSPDTGMTRAMFAAVIGRLYERSYGTIPASRGNMFADTDPDEYYAKYVDWAAASRIITGVGGGRYEPDRKINREEMAAILYHFAEFLKASGTGIEGTELSFPDASGISSWAAYAVRYCQQTGIISGREGGNFVPQGIATRAEVAVIIQKFVDNIVGNR